MARQGIINEVAKAAPDRRHFLKVAGLAGTALTATATTPAGPTDADILNFALNLEYLESEFYSVATSGHTIDYFGIATSGDQSKGAYGATTGGHQVNFNSSVIFTGEIALQQAQSERDHVTYIRSVLTNVLGVEPIAKPAIFLDALGMGFNGDSDYLQVSRSFEDTGVSAYAGAAPLLKNATVLAGSARILAAEAEFVANVRLQIERFNIATMALDPKDIIPPPSGTKNFSLDQNGLCETRTPQEVLYIAYHGAGLAKGGFFPNGVNGYFHGMLSVEATGLTPD